MADMHGNQHLLIWKEIEIYIDIKYISIHDQSKESDRWSYHKAQLNILLNVRI